VAAKESDNVVIGVPEVYEMLVKMKGENEQRDNELKALILGNGKPGVMGRLTKLETIFKVILGILLPVAAFVIRGLFS